ncbi:MAG: amino acid adenylation domain-containing protein, partial [Actinomycetota bacterium]|nr:amino acid adenylation domain-containing protein [Actinomycetota bacterium]
YTSSQTPQVWLNGFAFEQHGGLVVQFDSVDGLFPEGMIEAMVQGYQSLLDSLLTEPAWSATTFELLPESQLASRRETNDTATALSPARLEEAFVAQVERDPDATAVITAQASLSYGELYRQAVHAATWLRANQVGRDELVGLVMTRGSGQLIGILATVLAGGAYLPIDAGLPVERQRYMLADGRVRCVLTNAEATEAADGLAVLRLGESASIEDTIAPLPDASLDDLAYVLYTSGTTGEPKGVMVSQRSVANVVADCQRRFDLRPTDRFFGISAFNFDLSVWDVFGALSAGAAIVLPDHHRAADPGHWLELSTQAGVTVWNSVPAIVALALDQAVAESAEGSDPLPALRLVMMSGDRIPPELPSALRALKPDLEVVSLGGPTETTIWNILYPIDAGYVGDTIPYGRPNANNRAYILDGEGLDTPDWVAGEICAAGTGLARGYWGDQARTDARFFSDERRGERLFRTGDLGRYLPDGTIAILGRSDFQIKINGYRIEAGEVETRLVGIAEIKQAAVVRQAGARGDRLVAHLAAAGASRPADEAIRTQLREYLPEYMLPSAMLWHESLPLTRNGKIDRSKLIAEQLPVAGAAGHSAGSGPANEIEKELTGVWAAVLKCSDSELELEGSFYAVGGDSLAAARILTGVRKHFGISITLDRFFEVDTIRTMAAHIAAARQAKAAAVAGS